MSKRVKIGNDEISIEYRIAASEKMECFVNGVLFDRFRLLSFAINTDTQEEANSILSIAKSLFSQLDDEVFNDMHFVTLLAVRDKFCYHEKKNELYYQRMFNETYSKIRNGVVVSHEHDGKNIPDSWVMIGNDLYPVEVKKEKFDATAMRQLTRYIRAYKTKGGIAVGRTLKTVLPPNVEFIPISELETAMEESRICS